jgi:hypothetical protein
MMPNAVQLLTSVLESGPKSDEKYRWQDLHAAMLQVISAPLTSGTEHLLLSILRFDGRISLDTSSEVPHRMSTEDMLKSLAVQALARWTGSIYVRALRRLQASTTSPGLLSVVRAVLRQMDQPKKVADSLEAVAETSYAHAPNTPLRIRPLREEWGLTFWADTPVRRREEYEKVS